MNRIIKFKGKTITGNEWIFGDLEYNRDKGCSIIHTYYDNGIYEGSDVVWSNSVSQFSGLYDRNGAEIYEGDILEWEKDERKYVVKFWDGMFYASVEEYNKGIFGGFPLHALTDSEEGFRCKIVGNIHDGLH